MDISGNAFTIKLHRFPVTAVVLNAPGSGDKALSFEARTGIRAEFFQVLQNSPSAPRRLHYLELPHWTPPKLRCSTSATVEITELGSSPQNGTSFSMRHRFRRALYAPDPRTRRKVHSPLHLLSPPKQKSVLTGRFSLAIFEKIPTMLLFSTWSIPEAGVKRLRRRYIRHHRQTRNERGPPPRS